MSKSNRVKRPATRKVVDTSSKVTRVPAQEVASALGAHPDGKKLPKGLPASAQLELVAMLVREIQSSGGRPARREETERKNQGISSSPGQIGGLLVREELKQ